MWLAQGMAASAEVACKVLLAAVVQDRVAAAAAAATVVEEAAAAPAALQWYHAAPVSPHVLGAAWQVRSCRNVAAALAMAVAAVAVAMPAAVNHAAVQLARLPLGCTAASDHLTPAAASLVALAASDVQAAVVAADVAAAAVGAERNLGAQFLLAPAVCQAHRAHLPESETCQGQQAQAQDLGLMQSLTPCVECLLGPTAVWSHLGHGARSHLHSSCLGCPRGARGRGHAMLQPLCLLYQLQHQHQHRPLQPSCALLQHRALQQYCLHDHQQLLLAYCAESAGWCVGRLVSRANCLWPAMLQDSLHSCQRQVHDQRP